MIKDLSSNEILFYEAIFGAPWEPVRNKNEKMEMLYSYLSKLSPREEKIIRMRFGLGNEKQKYTLAAIGKEFGVNRERIRQIEAKALFRLREFLNINELSLNAKDTISQIQDIRTQNNKNWMALLKLAFKVAPKKTKMIMKDIADCDQKINELMRKFAN